MLDREAQADLRRLVAEWLARQDAPQSVTEAEELARQVAQAAGAVGVKQALPAVARRVGQLDTAAARGL